MPDTQSRYWILAITLMVSGFVGFIGWWVTAETTLAQRINQLTERVRVLEIECDD